MELSVNALTVLCTIWVGVYVKPDSTEHLKFLVSIDCVCRRLTCVQFKLVR